MTATLAVLALLACWLMGLLLAAEARGQVLSGYATERPPRAMLLRTQLVGTALNRVVPWGGGLVAAHGRLLARRGHKAEVIAACLGGYAVAGMVAHAALCGVAIAVIVSGVVPAHLGVMGRLPTVPWPALPAVGLCGVVAFGCWGRVRRRLAEWAVPLRAAFGVVRRSPGTLLQVAVLHVLAQLAAAVALFCALLATGTHAAVLAVVITVLLASVVAGLFPAPAGTGPAEAGLIGGLLLVGVAVGPATAGVVLYRLVTHWLPVPLGALFAGRELRDMVRARRLRRAPAEPAALMAVC